MIASVFRQNLFFNSLLMLPFAVLMRIYSFVFISENTITYDGGVLYKALLFILPDSQLFNLIFATIIIFLEASMINRLVIKNKFSRDITLFPGMFFIILTSVIPDMHYLSPFLIGVLFLILSFSDLFKSYKKFRSERLLFNTGFYLGLASLFYFNFILFFIPLFLGMLSIRAFKIIEIFQFLTGIFAILYFYSVWVFLSDQILTIPSLTVFSYSSYFSSGLIRNFILLIWIFIVIYAIFTYRQFVVKKSIQSQKKINIVFWILIYSIIIFVFVEPSYFLNYLTLTAFSLSIFTAMIFNRIKNTLLSEIVSVIIVFAILIYHFQFYNIS